MRYSVFCRCAVVWRDFLEANLFHVNLKFRIKSILMRIIMIFQTLDDHAFQKQNRELISENLNHDSFRK